jgi:hypothetical protein
MVIILYMVGEKNISVIIKSLIKHNDFIKPSLNGELSIIIRKII